MAGYDRSKNADYTLAVQSALKTLGADLGGPGVDGKWGKYTEAAYRKNRAAVDRLVSEMGVSAAGAYGSGSRLAAERIDVPEQKGWKTPPTPGASGAQAIPRICCSATRTPRATIRPR